MAQYNNTTKDNVKNLNQKQTVIVQVVTAEDGKKTKNIYLGNWKRRRDAYFLALVDIHKEDKKSQYRLLKLNKALAEVSKPGYNTKTNYLLIEGYDNETPVVYEAPEAEEAPAEEVVPEEETPIEE